MQPRLSAGNERLRYLRLSLGLLALITSVIIEVEILGFNVRFVSLVIGALTGATLFGMPFLVRQGPRNC